MRCTMLWMLAVLAADATVARDQSAPTSEELHQLVADKQYPQAMQKITAALALKGPAAKWVNRYDLFMLKAECHLQSKAISPAIDAFTSAAKEGTDDRERALATAHAALLKASKAFAYTPKAAPDKTRPVPIDILDHASRKQAFLALFVDELAANDVKFKAAKSAKSLPPIADACKPLMAMEGLELAAKEGDGDAEKVKSLRAELVEQAKKLLADALRAMSKRVGEIDKEAGTFVAFYQDVPNPYSAVLPFRREKAYRKKGLTDRQTKELQETTATCDKLSPALTELAAALKAEDKVFDATNDEASRIRKEIDRILDTDYMKVYREIPKK